MSRRNGSEQRIARLVLLTLALLLNGTILLHAQTPENLNAPQGRGLSVVASACFRATDARIDGYRIKGHLQELTAIARKSNSDGNQHWGSIAGQPSHDQVRQWTGAKKPRCANSG